MFSRNVRDQVSYRYKTTGTIIVQFLGQQKRKTIPTSFQVFRNDLSFHIESLFALRPTTSWMTTVCRLSATDCLVYL